MSKRNAEAEQVASAGYARVAEYYDVTPAYVNRADIRFYVDCARESGGRVLELGCGTGRILIPTAAAGCAIVGLDLSEPMLAKCREKLAQQPTTVQQRARVVQGNMSRFDLAETFNLVTIPFRGFQHLLAAEEQRACLRAAHRHLVAGGRLVFDVFHPNPEMLHDAKYQRETDEFPETALPDGRRFRRTFRIAAFHRIEQINEIEFAFYVKHPDGRQEVAKQIIPMRYFFRYELEHLLVRCGFRVEALYGDFDRSAMKDDSPEMIFVTEKQG
jgi:SAM-dependent methyltransferase